MLVSSYELEPNASQRTFHGKAKSYRYAPDDTILPIDDYNRIRWNGYTLLTSYDTPVLIQTTDRDGNDIYYRCWRGWSATKQKHIKSFCGLDKKGYLSLPYIDW